MIDETRIAIGMALLVATALFSLLQWRRAAIVAEDAIAHAEAWRKCAKRWEDIATKLALPGKPHD
jgi:hypothetical protein